MGSTILIIAAAFLALAGLVCIWAWLICLGRGAERLAAVRRAGIQHDERAGQRLAKVEPGTVLLHSTTGVGQPPPVLSVVRAAPFPPEPIAVAAALRDRRALADIFGHGQSSGFKTSPGSSAASAPARVR